MIEAPAADCRRRTDRRLAFLAITLSSVSLALVAPAVALAATRGTEVFWPSIMAATSFAVLGGLIASRRPRQPMGWLLLVVAASEGAVNFSSAYAVLVYAFAVPLPGGDVASWLSTWTWIPGVGTMVTFVFLLFPDGHMPSPRWRGVALVAGIDLALVVVGTAISLWSDRGIDLLGVDHPPPGSLAGTFYLWEVLLFAACVLASVASLVSRYRSADAMQRHQLKWFLFAAAILAPVVGSAFFYGFQGDVTAAPVAVQVAQTIGVTVLPTAIAIALFRYRLYDIDVVISRTLAYGSLAAGITAVYVAIVVGIGTLIGSGSQPNLALSIVATAIVAVAFQPMRDRLQKVANRLVYGQRATPYEVLSGFSRRVAESVAATDVLPRMARVLAEGTGAVHADVWLRSGTVLSQAASWPEAAGPAEPSTMTGESLPRLPVADRAVEVRHQGELLGALTVRKRAGDPLTPIEEKLLNDLAHQAGLVLKNVSLTAELLRRLEDLRASRQRLVAAQDQERRRLERDLHDGAQQNLVALKIRLGLAESIAEKDPAQASGLFSQLKSDADEAMETLRDLARGIYPPLLADRGLVAALQGQARKAPVAVDVEADGIGRYAQDVEATVYFCCLEALQNIAKYAQATAATVTLRATTGCLSFAVRDNGAGFDPATVARGSGLQNMSDRLDALGGSLEVTSAPGGGTTVHGRLPVSVSKPATSHRP